MTGHEDEIVVFTEDGLTTVRCSVHEGWSAHGPTGSPTLDRVVDGHLGRRRSYGCGHDACHDDDGHSDGCIYDDGGGD